MANFVSVPSIEDENVPVIINLDTVECVEPILGDHYFGEICVVFFNNDLIDGGLEVNLPIKRFIELIQDTCGITKVEKLKNETREIETSEPSETEIQDAKEFEDFNNNLRKHRLARLEEEKKKTDARLKDNK